MRRTYWTTERADGGTEVYSRGPVARAWHVVRILVACLFIFGALGCLFTGQWGASAVSLLVGAVVMPRRTSKGERWSSTTE